MKRSLRDELSGRDVRSLRDGGGNGSARFPSQIGVTRLHPSKSSDLIIAAEGLSSMREASLRWRSPLSSRTWRWLEKLLNDYTNLKGD